MFYFRSLTLAIAFLFGHSAGALTAAQQNALAGARQLVKAVETEDVDSIIALTHPKVHQMMGDAEKMRQQLNLIYQMAKLTKVSATSAQVTFSPPGEVFKVGGQSALFIP